MSRPKQVVVSRDYRPDSAQCARALGLLLKKPVNEGGPATAPGRAKGGSENDSSPKTIIQSRPS